MNSTCSSSNWSREKKLHGSRSFSGIVTMHQGICIWTCCHAGVVLMTDTSTIYRLWRMRRRCHCLMDRHISVRLNVTPSETICDIRRRGSPFFWRGRRKKKKHMKLLTVHPKAAKQRVRLAQFIGAAGPTKPQSKPVRKYATLSITISREWIAPTKLVAT